MELFAQQVLNGLVTGSVYSLVALGLTLIYGTMHVPNFAHGHLYMLGAYLSYTLVTRAGLNYWAAMAVSVAVLATIGAALERLVFRPLRHAPHLNAMIAALGVMLFLEAVAQQVWGEEFRHMDSPYQGVASVFGLLITQHRLILAAAAAALMVGLLLFLTRTVAGSAIRATAQNPEGALLVGIATNRVAMATFAISAALAAVAGSLVAPISLVYPSMGTMAQRRRQDDVLQVDQRRAATDEWPHCVRGRRRHAPGRAPDGAPRDGAHFPGHDPVCRRDGDRERAGRLPATDPFEEMNKLVPMAMLEHSVGVMPTVHHPDFRSTRFVEKYRARKGADRDPPREVSLTYGAMRILARAMELAGTTTDARAIHAVLDEAAKTLPDEAKPSELLGVDASGHLEQTTVAAHVVGGKFVPLYLTPPD